MAYKKNERKKINCGECGVVIVTGRTKGQTAQKYCSEGCKWRAWDRANPRMKAKERQNG